jgi:hypothetical protein
VKYPRNVEIAARPEKIASSQRTGTRSPSSESMERILNMLMETRSDEKTGRNMLPMTHAAARKTKRFPPFASRGTEGGMNAGRTGAEASFSAASGVAEVKGVAGTEGVVEVEGAGLPSAGLSGVRKTPNSNKTRIPTRMKRRGYAWATT